MTVKDLIDYINENLADGCFDIDSEVNVKQYDESITANGLLNDCGELTIVADI